MTYVGPRVVVLQDGARLHYAIPLVLQSAGILERVYTDWYSAPGSLSRLAAKIMALAGSKLGVRMLDRMAPDLPSRTVWSNPSLTIRFRARRHRYASQTEYFAFIAEQLARWVLRKGFGQGNALFGFIRNIHPLLLSAAREQGLSTFGDQMIAPYKVQYREEEMQHQRFPGWSPQPPQPFDTHLNDLEKNSWKNLTAITCASPYVRDGLIAEGIAADSIYVLPYPIESAKYPFVDRRGRTGPLTVGFVGSVDLRKGAPYFFEVARRFDPAQVRFVMVGPVQLSDMAIARRGNVELIGQVPRSEIHAWLSKLDMYLFPTTCEGSAGSIMEAMASGLPVITTPNSGAVASDGFAVRVAPYHEVDRLAGYINQLAARADERHDAGMAASKIAAAYHLKKYQDGLVATIGARALPQLGLSACPPPPGLGPPCRRADVH